MGACFTTNADYIIELAKDGRKICNILSLNLYNKRKHLPPSITNENNSFNSINFSCILKHTPEDFSTLLP